jgi:ADP-heptose:LPS heptosyltransferase
MAADLRYPPISRPASDFGPPARPARLDSSHCQQRGWLAELPRGPLDLLCPRPLHHVLEYAALYGFAAALRADRDGGAPGAGGHRVRLFLRSALADWSPFARLPVDEIGRLPEAGEDGACEELLGRLRAGNASCLLLGADPTWEELAAGLPSAAGRSRLRRLPLAPEFQWRLAASPGCTAAGDEFFAALARASPRWLAAAVAPPALAPGGPSRQPPRFLVYQGRSHLGDMLWLTPLLRAIARLFPSAGVTVVGGAAAAQALAGNPHCTELLIDGPPEGRAGRDPAVEGLAEEGPEAEGPAAQGPVQGEAVEGGAEADLGLEEPVQKPALQGPRVEQLAARRGLLDQLRRRRFDAALFAFAARPRSRWLAEAAAELGIPRRVDLEYFEHAGDGRALDPLFTHQGWFFWGTQASPRLLLHALEPLGSGAADGTPGPLGPAAADGTLGPGGRSPAAGMATDWRADRRLDFFVGEAWRRAAAARLAAHGCSGRPFAVLAPAARSSQRWPPRKFAALAHRLAAELGLHVLIEGAEADAPVLDAVAAHLAAIAGPGGGASRGRAAAAPAGGPGAAPAPSPAVPPPAAVEAAAQGSGRIGVYRDPLGVLAALLERASLLVSNDSAPIHLAAASGTPTLYFAHHEKLTHSHPGGPACWALFDGSRNRLARISVDQAAAAISEMFRQGLVRTAAPLAPA